MTVEMRNMQKGWKWEKNPINKLQHTQDRLQKLENIHNNVVITAKEIDQYTGGNLKEYYENVKIKDSTRK